MEKIIAILLTLIISITALGNETIKIVAQETNKIVTEGSKSNSEKNDEIIFDLEEESIELGTKEYVALNYEFKSEGEKILSWESDDESIAIVDRGVVQGKKSGSTKVKVYSNDILLDECEVIVREEKERESSRSYQDYIELNKGTIYTIKNTSKDTIMIYEGYGSNFKVDEIIYSSSGEVESYYKGKGTSIFLGAGKTAKIKVIEGEGIYTTTAKGKYLLLTDGQGDVFKEIKFSNGSYRIKNNSDEAISIGNINGEKIDGYIESDYWGPDFFYSEGGPGSIQPEETAVFSSSAGETVEFYFPKEYKVDVEYSSKPAVDKIILQSDMVYDFSKSLDKSYRLFSSKDEKGEETSFKVEFIEYEEDNDLLNLGYISNYGTTGSGRYTNLEIRKIYGSIIMMLPYGNKEFISKREEKDPLVKQIDLFKDKHYIIKNNTSNDINMSHFSSDINIIAYNDKGSIVDCKSDNFETGYNNRKIIAKGKSKIGGVEDKGFILIPYEGFTVEEIETPVWGNMEIEANKKVKIKNTTGDVTALHGSGMYKYAYKVYSANGKLEYEGDTLASLYISNILPNQTVEVTLLEGNSASLLMEYSLLPESALKRPIVKSVMMINGNKEIDISKNYVKINKNSKEAKKIRVDVNWNGKKAKEVRLQQGSSYISSEDGNFDIVFGKEFNETDNIYAIAVSQDDKVSTPVLLNTQLKNISNSITGGNDTGSVNLGQVSATTIPEKVPFVGAEKLDINYSNIKFTAQYDEKKGTLKVIFGKNLYKLDSIKFQEAYNDAKIAYQLKKPSLNKSNVFKIGNWTFNGNTGVEGYAEYAYNATSKDFDFISGGIAGIGSLNTKVVKHFIVSYMPMYIKATILGDLKLGLNLSSNNSSSIGNYNLNGSFAITPTLEPEGGIGVDGISTLGLYGGLEIKVERTKFSGKSEVTPRGYIGGKFTAGELFNVKVQLWSSDGKSISKSSNINVYDSENYELISRDYLSENSGWNGDTVSLLNRSSTLTNEKNRVLESGIFSNAQPILGKIGGKQIMLWLRDNEKRDDINRTQLVYSIYDDNKKTWSEPNVVSQSDTADYYPQVAYDDNNLYVSWQRSKKVMDSNASLEDICKESEIVVAKFNTETNTFEKEVTLTNNNTYDGVPIICINNGKVFVSWKNNSENDIFGLKGKNSIMYSEFDGNSWSKAKTLLNDCNNILSMNAIYNDKQVYMAYSMDNDKNPDTVDDKDVYYVTVSEGRVNNPTKVSSAEGLNTNPQLVNNKGEIGLFWYNNDTILYKKDISSSESENVFSNKENIGTDRFKVIKDDDNLGLIWLKSVDDSIEVYGCLYDSNNKEFTEPVQLTTIGERTQSVDGIFNEKSEIVLASNVAEKVEKEENGYKYFDDGINSLVVTTINPSFNIKVDSEPINVDDSEFLIGEKIQTTFNIENTGQLYVDKVKVEVYDKNPDDGGVLNNSETIDVNLKPGVSTQISTNFTPMKAEEYDVYIKVSLIGKEESDKSDNILSFKVGSADIAIKDTYITDIEENRALRMEISNNGAIDSENVNLIIRKKDKDGEILFTKELGSISNESNKIVDYVLDESKIDYDEGGQAKVYIELDTKNQEKYTYNNSEYMIIDKKMDVKDLNKDGSIDILDIATMAQNYNSDLESDNWNFSYDLNDDLIIDIFDLVLLSKEIE